MNIYEIKCVDDDGIETSLKLSSDMETVEDLEEVLEKLFTCGRIHFFKLR